MIAQSVFLTSQTPDPRRSFCGAKVLAGWVLLVCVGATGGLAQTQGSIDMTPGAEQAIAKSLAWLARSQRSDGSWGQSTAETSVAGLAYMVTGEVPGRGKYARQTSRALQYILGNVQENGLILGRSRRSPMYHHGLATLYLTQVWGLTGYETVREKLKKSVDLIIASQSSRGGWRYFPGRDDQDISVTVMQLVSLRAARNCGIEVPDKTIENAINYVRALSHNDGGFGYQSSHDRGIARTGAGMFSLQVCGEYDDPRIAQGLKYLEARGMFDGQWQHYGLYYISASLYQIGGSAWGKHYPVIRDHLIKTQRRDGDWGESYKTSMAVLSLAVPYRYLPIYQR